MKKAFLLRLKDEEYERLKVLAHKKGVSLNQLCSDTLRVNPYIEFDSNSKAKFAQNFGLQKELKKLPFGIEATAVFGSVARETARKNSDCDLLLIVSDEVVLNASLYRSWERVFSNNEEFFNFSPHFVHLPKNLKSVGSLWLECAIEAKVIFDTEDLKLEKLLSSLRKNIAEGYYVRKYAYGVPYWKRMMSDK